MVRVTRSEQRHELSFGNYGGDPCKAAVSVQSEVAVETGKMSMFSLEQRSRFYFLFEKSELS